MKNDPLQLGSQDPIVPDFTVCVWPTKAYPWGSLPFVSGLWGFCYPRKSFQTPYPFSMVTLHCTFISWVQNMYFQHTHTYGHLWTEQRTSQFCIEPKPEPRGTPKVLCHVWPQGHFLQECERTGVSTIEEGREKAWHLACGALVFCEKKTRASPEWHKLACVTRWGRTCCPL